jgi:hypothetical protein
MPTAGWKPLLDDHAWYHGDGHYPIGAYSEFMPPPRLGRKPYGARDPVLFTEDDPYGWHVTEYEEALELRPGLEDIARQVVGALARLGRGKPARGISRHKLADNPYWPPELADRAGRLGHERFVTLLPLALARTQDDKGRVRWTLFGASEQGPARAFWKSFFTAPGRELPDHQALRFLRRLLREVYGEPDEALTDLHGAGLRILPQAEPPALPFWREGPLPSWADRFALAKGQALRGVKYLLTFQPFGRLPAPVRQAYLAGELHLLPFPGSLVFWGAEPYLRMHEQLPLALQVPLLPVLERHVGWFGVRVPQSGWLHEPRPGKPAPDDHPVRNTYKRTHRWHPVHRDEDELAQLEREDKVAHVLFSTAPQDLGLYDKPMARNAQLWTHDFRVLLDGPNADPADIKRAEDAVVEGGLFGYRFQWPAMCVGRHEVYWHRPLVAYLSGRTGEPVVLPEAPLGYLTAYRADRPDLARPVELWPRPLQRGPHLEAVRLFAHATDPRPYQTTRNVHKLLDARRLFGRRPLPRSLARRLLTLPKHETLDGWLDSLPDRANDPEAARRLADELWQVLEPEEAPLPRRRGARVPDSLTFARTARRSFEVAYWKGIAALAEGRYLNKNNADCVTDPATRKLLPHHHRDLEALGDHLLAHYRQEIAAAGLTGKALAGEVPFRWQTDFAFPWMGGWEANQQGKTHERDLLVIIPGRDRRRAVIMADHYDTAYMADRYDPQEGGKGARLAAAGADDNHSATVALMLAAPILLGLSRAGRLGCDIWLVHLTGEEFPADCLGARHLCQRLVEGDLHLHLPGDKTRDLSGVRVQGVYVLDMIAHNNDHDRDIFQIAPGASRQSLWLALQAHLANEIWNASVPVWNQKSSRRGRGRARRSASGAKVPAVARHPALSGEVRPPFEPRSTLYNTDGQIFSDAGVPVVLFMENYDINREGYHDTHDTMANIDLDYGAALAAITIETVARAATEEPPH